MGYSLVIQMLSYPQYLHQNDLFKWILMT